MPLFALVDGNSFYASCAAEKLRSQHSHARLVAVSIRTNRFRQQDAQYAGREV